MKDDFYFMYVLLIYYIDVFVHLCDMLIQHCCWANKRCIVNSTSIYSARISSWRYYHSRIHLYQFSIEKFRYTRVSRWPKSARRGV